ncbi:MAG: hypothetical protein CR988_03720 [Treponema sp.]|nr:MAG: hypothetical protein CR988_03720 [Treponema sp.]
MFSYYYVMSQLPSISSRLAPPLSYERFLDIVEIGTPAKDFEMLKTISLEPPKKPVSTGSVFLDKWYGYERALRFSLAKIRAENLNWTGAENHLNREDIMEAMDVVQVARGACAIDDPRKAEEFLDKARFSAAEQLKGLENFNKESLFAYAVMLLLRERAMKFDTEAGRQEYNAIYDKILES